MFDYRDTHAWFCPHCGGGMQYEGPHCWLCVECGETCDNTMDMLVWEEACATFIPETGPGSWQNRDADDGDDEDDEECSDECDFDGAAD